MQHICGSGAVIGRLALIARLALPGAACLTMLMPTAAAAQRNDSVSVEDVAVQPLRDVNLANDEIPSLLLEAMADPYSTDLVEGCDSIGRLIGYYDNVLGPDIDLPDDDTTGEKRRRSAGNIAKSFVGGLIPFRSVVREISGASDRARLQREAVAAGLMRRAFLKGIGLEKGCDYPARPATGIVDFDEAAHSRINDEDDQSAAEPAADDPAQEDAGDSPSPDE